MSERAIGLEPYGAGELVGEPASSAGILERLPDEMCEKLPNELVEEPLAGATSCSWLLLSAWCLQLQAR